MDMLELECPNCKEMLELDVGFAGGVCRCSNCNILMTVPENPASERAEKLIRPERPDSPVGKDEEAPDAEMDLATQLARETAFETGTYTTESGKSYQIEADTYIPTAHKAKRPAVRATVAAVFLLLMASVVAVCAFAMMLLIHGAPEGGVVQLSEDFLTGYDATVTPYDLNKPNVIGLPIGAKTVVVLDASSQGRTWLGVAKDMIVHGVSHDYTQAQVQIVIGSIDGAEVFPDQPQPMVELDRAGLKSFLKGFLAMGQPDIHKAIDLALTHDPKQVVLVTGRRLDDETIGSISKTLEIAPGAQFDVMLIDAPVTDAIKELVNRHKGVCETLDSDQLQRWYNQTL